MLETRKTAAKKATAKKKSTKKITAKKPVTKKTAARKATAKKTTAKKATTRKITRKPTTKSSLKRQDLVAIAKLAKLSISTLVKWYDGTLPVKPETELKIFKATDRFYEQEVSRLMDHLEKLTEIEDRISLQRTGVKQAIQEMRKIKVKKRAD